MEVRLDSYVSGEEALVGDPDVVIIATGGQAQLPPLETGDDLVVTSWDVLGGQATVSGRVLVYDDNGTHSALSAAEVIALTGATVELVTPERSMGIDVGGMNIVPYARAFNECNVRITLNQRVLAVRRAGAGGRGCGLEVTLGSDYSSHTTTREVDHVVVDHGAAANDTEYFEIKSRSSNLGAVDYGALLEGRPQTLVRNPAGSFQLFRIGDAVANRNIHAAIYDALRLVKDL